jgi:hypothetical protein
MPKDDVLTLKLPGANLVFTRYLYIKDEVKTALLISILNKSDDAIFWAYELYYSGFKNELYAFIWQIYYDFFATQNPGFAVYLSKKLGQSLIEDRLISSVVQNLLIRSFNTDVFLLRTIAEYFETEEDPAKDLGSYLLDKDYRGLALYVFSNKELNVMDTYQIVLDYFKLTNHQKLVKDFIKEIEANTVSKKVILVANILSIITFARDLIKKKNFYVKVDPEEVVQYETIEADANLKPYRILKHACICQIDKQSFLNLFQGFRNQNIKNGLKEKYDGWTISAVLEKYNSLNKWLYHAAFSPVWFARIKSCKGYVDYEKNEVKFVSEEWEEVFYNRFNLEPDEQSLQTKENTLGKGDNNRKSTWQQFFAKYKKLGLIDALEEELDELNEEPLKY